MNGILLTVLSSHYSVLQEDFSKEFEITAFEMITFITLSRGRAMCVENHPATSCSNHCFLKLMGKSNNIIYTITINKSHD